MQDLLSLAKDSMWCTSQAAGNMTSDRPKAMSAPGSEPVDPIPGADEQGDPTVKLGTPAKPGPPGPWNSGGHDDGTPASRLGYSPARPSWKKTN